MSRVYIRDMLKEKKLFEELKKENEERPMLVYIAHPMGGDIVGNKAKVLDICRTILSDRTIPFAPYLTAFEYLDDNDPNQRRMGMEMNRYFFEQKIIDVLLVCGDRISSGVRSEIKLALENDITIAILDESRREEVENVIREILIEITDGKSFNQ